eukprot:jgi/Picsp_1/1500/NSC_04978-R1_3-hydroxyisobutyryl- mitochondrial
MLASCGVTCQDGAVEWSRRGPIGILTLNRPKALNALNLDMVNCLYGILMEWKSVSRPGAVVLTAGRDDRQLQKSKAFCAGGDVKQIVQRGIQGDTEYGMNFFVREYFLDYLISGYDVPYMSIMDGIVFGGGVGASIHGTFQIATENSVFAMPECAIGLFPDVGGSYFLSRLEGGLGMYLGLTGARLKGIDLKLAGVATHYVHSSFIPKLLQDLETLPTLSQGRSKVSKAESEKEIGKLLRMYEDATEQPASELSLLRDDIDAVFANASSVEEIVQACQQGQLDNPFLKGTLDMIMAGSPLSLKLTFKQLSLGKKMSLSDCFKTDHRLIHRLTKDTDSDFYRGVQARLIDKSNMPIWKEPCLSRISSETIDWYFSPLPAHQELQLPSIESSSCKL